MTRMTGWEAVAGALEIEGVKRVYGLPGDPVHLYDALYDRPAVQPVLVHHEASGVFMAMAAEMFGSAVRPVLVAGGGVVLSGAGAALSRLAEQEHMPVMTTFSGRGSISEEHEAAFGLVGLYRTRPGKDVFNRADLLIT